MTVNSHHAIQPFIKPNLIQLMNSVKVLIGTIPLILLAGCSNPADDVPAAAVGKASNSATNTAPASAPGDRYFVLDPNSSPIQFVGSKVTGSHNGGFKQFAGELKVSNGRLADSGNKVVIDINSTWSDSDRLTGHLKSPDFFDAARYPTATFVSTAILPAGDGATVTGDLTLHGVTKSISFPAKIQVSEGAVQVSAEFALNRFDFEIKYPGKADDLIRKEVVLKLNINAAPGRANFAPVETAAAGTAL
jgi:polyisoprenoid-binding protein YceI